MDCRERKQLQTGADLRCSEGRGADCVCKVVVVAQQHTARSQVRDSHMSIVAKEKIRWLDIAMQNMSSMHFCKAAGCQMRKMRSRNRTNRPYCMRGRKRDRESRSTQNRDQVVNTTCAAP
jgi:hypothetical protein